MKIKDINRLKEILTPELELGPLKIFYTNELKQLSEIALAELENSAKSENESEEKSMLHNVTVKHEEDKVLEEFWLMRTIKDGDMCGQPTTQKRVISERELDHEPTPDEIAQFLYDSKADFVSVVQNYRFENELPF